MLTADTQDAKLELQSHKLLIREIAQNFPEESIQVGQDLVDVPFDQSLQAGQVLIDVPPEQSPVDSALTPTETSPVNINTMSTSVVQSPVLPTETFTLQPSEQQNQITANLPLILGLSISAFLILVCLVIPYAHSRFGSSAEEKRKQLRNKYLEPESRQEATHNLGYRQVDSSDYSQKHIFAIQNEWSSLYSSTTTPKIHGQENFYQKDSLGDYDTSKNIDLLISNGLVSGSKSSVYSSDKDSGFESKSFGSRTESISSNRFQNICLNQKDKNIGNSNFNSNTASNSFDVSSHRSDTQLTDNFISERHYNGRFAIKNEGNNDQCVKYDYKKPENYGLLRAISPRPKPDVMESRRISSINMNGDDS